MIQGVRAILLLTFLCAALAASVLEGARQLSAFRAPSPIQVAAGEAEADLLWQEPEETDFNVYQPMLAYPPLDPKRGVAPAPEPAPEPTVAKAGPVKPVAVITSSYVKLVLIEVPDKARLVRAKLGDKVAGWKVIAIMPREVVLEDSDGYIEVIRVSPTREGDGQGAASSSTVEDGTSGTAPIKPFFTQQAAFKEQAADAPKADAGPGGGAAAKSNQTISSIPVSTPEAIKRLFKLPPDDGGQTR